MKESKYIDYSELAFGILLMFLGVFYLLRSGDFHNHWGFPVSNKLGYIFLPGGLALIIHSHFKKRSNNSSVNVLVCDQCKNIYPISEVQDAMCPICSCELISPKGYINSVSKASSNRTEKGNPKEIKSDYDFINSKIFILGIIIIYLFIMVYFIYNGSNQ
jgi:hypothetical protein